MHNLITSQSEIQTKIENCGKNELKQLHTIIRAKLIQLFKDLSLIFIKFIRYVKL